mmetsp:Transcript_25787/g.59365  ORF Transcript_25787/g.59365 Transcript_25787/m.59365 type:complete len:235 (+) Transcript_25787:676-1380(+)
MAALVFPPHPSPSTNPAPNATTFLSAPQASAPATSSTCRTPNVGVWKRRRVRSSRGSPKREARVASHGSPSATSPAMLAPIRTPHRNPGPKLEAMEREIRVGRRAVSSKSRPLIRLTPRQDGCTTPVSWGRRRGKNWWGRTKTSSVAPSAAFLRSGTATTLSGMAWPGRYFTFSWSWLMMSVRFRPSTSSSWTHMSTRVAHRSCWAAFRPSMMAIVDPQLPEPTMQIFSGIEGG